MSTQQGTVTGTGAAINISLGWLPDYVRVVNASDGDTIDEWHVGMASGTSVTTGTGTSTRATGGISQYNGTAATPLGFTIGSGISETDKTLTWFASRNSINI